MGNQEEKLIDVADFSKWVKEKRAEAKKRKKNEPKKEKDTRLKVHKYVFKESLTPSLRGRLFLKGDVFYIYETPRGCFVVIDINREYINDSDNPVPFESGFIQDFIKAGELIESFVKEPYSSN